MEILAQMVSPLERDLRASLEVGSLAWAICQSDRAMQARPIPERFSDLHSDERRKYQNKALEVLMSLNRDAELYAELQAEILAWNEFEGFCSDRGLDWCSEHPVNADDQLECLIDRVAKACVKRYRQTLNGVWPGLSRHLARQERLRATDTNPDLLEGA